MTRHAAVTLHGLEGEAPSIGAEQLGDVQAAFERKHTTVAQAAPISALSRRMFGFHLHVVCAVLPTG